MKGLRAAIRRYDRESLTLLQEACDALDRLRDDLTPAAVKSLQDGLRGVLAVTEERLACLSARRKRRRSRLTRRRVERNRSILGPHNDLLQTREALVGRRRDALRQIADALMWLVLRGDKRIIGLLYDGSRSHRLPSENAMLGQLVIEEQLGELPDVFVLDNDLSRVLGFGDLTVVRAAPAPLRPLPLEVRTRGDVQKDGARIEIHTVLTDVPFDDELLQLIGTAIQLDEGPGPAEGSRKARQLSEISDRTERLFRIQRDRRPGLPAPDPVHRGSLLAVIQTAGVRGQAFDIPEAGLAYAAVRVSEGVESINEAIQPTIASLERLGFAPNDPRASFVKSDDVTRLDKYSVIVPPIPLWDIPSGARAQVMNFDLILLCFFAPELWSLAFAAVGLTLHEDEKGWEVERAGGETSRFSPVEMMHAKIGAAFLGFSPRQVARVVAESAGT